MEYTEKEKAVLRSIRYRTRNGGVAGIDEIIKDTYEGKRLPKHPRKAVSATIRILKLKLQINNDGQITRDSDVGAGNLGEYVYHPLGD